MGWRKGMEGKEWGECLEDGMERMKTRELNVGNGMEGMDWREWNGWDGKEWSEWTGGNDMDETAHCHLQAVREESKTGAVAQVATVVVVRIPK